MESESEGRQILPHSCPQCIKGAWVICDLCNESRLSRLCPICNGEYSPLMLYMMPNDQQFLEYIKDRPLDKQAICLKALQFSKLKLITVSNVVVYDATAKTLKFSLPVDTSLPPKSIRYMTVSLPLVPQQAISSEVEDSKKVLNQEYINSIIDRINTKVEFAFNNTIWDFLEHQMETDASTSSASSENTTDIRGAMAFILNALGSNNTFSEPNSLFTCLTPEEIMNLTHEDSISNVNNAL